MQCFKCKGAVAVVASREGAKKSYCVECLVDVVTRSVRDCFFRNCRVPPSPVPVVLAVSGGYSSMAMMEALGVLRVQNMQRGGAGRIVFDFHVLHLAEVEEVPVDAAPSLLSTSPTLLGATKDIISLAARVVDTSQFEKHNNKKKVAARERILVSGASPSSEHDGVRQQQHQQHDKVKKSGATPDPHPLYPTDRVHIRSMRRYCDYPFWEGGAGDATATLPPLAIREDLYLQARRRAILAAATEIVTATSSGSSDNTTPSVTNDAYVLFGDNAVTCAVAALDCTIRGRGANIVDLCGYSGHLHWRAAATSETGSDDHTDDLGDAGLLPPFLHVRRPMRDMLPKELVVYCRAQNVPWTGSALQFRRNVAAPLTAVAGSAGSSSPAASHSSQNTAILYSPSPLTNVSGRSVYRTLESFVLSLCEGGTYRSTVFNILNAVEKLAVAYTDELGSIAAEKQRNEIQQKRFGPKNAALFASGAAGGQQLCESTSPSDGGGRPRQLPAVRYGITEALLRGQRRAAGHADDEDERAGLLQACLLCGGSLAPSFSAQRDNTIREGLRESKTLTFCHGCTHALRRLGGSSGSANGVEFVERLLLRVPGGPQPPLSHADNDDGPAKGLRKLTSDEVRSEIAEFLLDQE